MKVDFSKVVELSHDMIPSKPKAEDKPFDHSEAFFPGPGEEPFRLMAQTYDVSVMGERGEPHPEGSWYVSGEVFFWTHCGTHVEFPFHHRKDGMQAQDFPLDHLIGECSVVDFTDKKAGDAMDWLLNEKKIIAIGTDATSLENFNHKNEDGIDDQPNHNNIFQHNCAMVESLTNLDKIEGGRALCFILPLKIHGIEACPVRIVAINKGGLIEE